jgi:hypothetical protein
MDIDNRLEFAILTTGITGYSVRFTKAHSVNSMAPKGI